MAVLDLAQLSYQLQTYQQKTRAWASQRIVQAQRTLQADEEERLRAQREDHLLRRTGTP